MSRLVSKTILCRARGVLDICSYYPAAYKYIVADLDMYVGTVLRPPGSTTVPARCMSPRCHSIMEDGICSPWLQPLRSGLLSRPCGARLAFLSVGRSNQSPKRVW